MSYLPADDGDDDDGDDDDDDDDDDGDGDDDDGDVVENSGDGNNLDDVYYTLCIITENDNDGAPLRTVATWWKLSTASSRESVADIGLGGIFETSAMIVTLCKI